MNNVLVLDTYKQAGEHTDDVMEQNALLLQQLSLAHPVLEKFCKRKTIEDITGSPLEENEWEEVHERLVAIENERDAILSSNGCELLYPIELRARRSTSGAEYMLDHMLWHHEFGRSEDGYRSISELVQGAKELIQERMEGNTGMKLKPVFYSVRQEHTLSEQERREMRIEIAHMEGRPGDRMLAGIYKKLVGDYSVRGGLSEEELREFEEGFYGKNGC